jgi:hypothetical protein
LRKIGKAAEVLKEFHISDDVLREFVYACLKGGYEDGFLQK